MSVGKMYHHRIPGAKFYMPDGKEICFAGGDFHSSMIKDTKKRAEVELELDKIANVPSSQIFTTDVATIGAEEAGVVKEIRDSATTSFDGANKITGKVETIEIPVAKDPKPVIAQSNVSAASVAAAREAVKKAEDLKKSAQGAAQGQAVQAQQPKPIDQ